MDKNDVNDVGNETNDGKGKAIPTVNNLNRVSKPTGEGQNKRNLTIIKRSNKLIQALNLPNVMNVNPRSIYNKIQEFHTFVKEESIDCVFMSESWERPDHPLNEIINLPNHEVISNPHKRKGVGGRPALIINKEK